MEATGSLQARVCHLERQLASTTAQYNEQVRKLEMEGACLRSSLERNEATKQQLQYHLEVEQNAGRQREAEWSADRQRREEESRERERETEKQQQIWQAKLSKLGQQCQEWSSTLEKVQQARAQERGQTERVITAKERELCEQRERVGELEAVGREMGRDLDKERSTTSNLKKVIEELEGELERRGEEEERVRREVKAVREQESQLQHELQVATERGRVLEERLEAEKAAHLNTKFTNDAAQLQVRELQTTLDGERKAREEFSGLLQQTGASIQAVQSTLEASTKREHALQKTLHSREAKCHSLEQRVKKKEAMIAELSQQMKEAESTCRGLQERLAQAKQQTGRWEEGCGKWVREMREILSQHSPHSTRHIPHDKSTAPPPSSSLSLTRVQLAQVTEQLRTTLTHHHSLSQSTKTELSAVRERVRQVEGECEKYRQALSSRESAMTEVEQRVSESTERVSELQSRLQQSKMALSAAREVEERIRGEREGERHSWQEAEKQLEALRTDHKEQLKARCSELGSIVTSLQALLGSTPRGMETSLPVPGVSGSRRQPADSNWSTLLSRATSTISTLAEQLNTARTETRRLQSEAESQRATLTTAQNMHRDTMEKLTGTLGQHEAQWREESSELSRHYSALLREAEQRTRQLQQFADEALHKAEEACSARLQLQTQLSQLRETAGGYKRDRACLLSSLVLLSSTFFPLLDRVRWLVLQKTLLSSQLAGRRSLEQEVTEVLNSLLPQPDQDTKGENTKFLTDSSRLGPSGRPQTTPTLPHPFLRFRRVVIVALAVLRLRALCRESSLVFTSPAPASATSYRLSLSLPVCIGGTYKKTSSRSSHPTPQELAAWLRSARVMKAAREATSELHRTADTPTLSKLAGVPPNSSGSLSGSHTTLSAGVNLPLQSSYSSLINSLSSLFAAPSKCSLIPSSPSTSGPPRHGSTGKVLCYSSECLAHRLARGLSARNLSSYVSPSELSKALSSQVSGLLCRLHRSDHAHLTLHSLLQQTSSECQRLVRGQQQRAEQLLQQVETLQNEVSSRVPSSQYEAVCRDIEATSHREREAQTALHHLTTTTQQLQTQLQAAVSVQQSKESALTETVKELSGVRLEVRQRDLQLGRTEKQWLASDSERQALAQQLQAVQSSLQNAIREKEVCEEMMEAAGMAFCRSRQQLREAQNCGDTTHTARLVQKVVEEFASQRPDFSQELGPTKTALQSFTQAHHTALSSVASLHSQLACARDHIEALKAELSAVCSRETVMAVPARLGPGAGSWPEPEQLIGRETTEEAGSGREYDFVALREYTSSPELLSSSPTATEHKPHPPLPDSPPSSLSPSPSSPSPPSPSPPPLSAGLAAQGASLARNLHLT